MHDYQVEWSREDKPLNPRDLRDGFGTFATGVTIITARAPDGTPIGCTANSFSSVSLDPPLILWSLARTSLSLDAFKNAPYFAVNVLTTSQLDLARKFAMSDVAKYAGVSYREGLGGAPLLEGSMAQFECATAATYDGGDHIIFLGRVERFRWRADDPLLFYRGRFPRLAMPKEGEIT